MGDKKELLKVEIEQKRFKCNQEQSRFLAYAVFLLAILLTGEFNKLNWYLFFSILFSIIIFITLKRIVLLRREIENKYSELISLIKR